MCCDPLDQRSDRSAKGSRTVSKFRVPLGLLRHTSDLRGEALLSNAFFLTLNTCAMGLFGFLFWVLAAHLFAPRDVGLAATFITAAGLISFVSQCGFNSSLVAFLPTSRVPSRIINSGLRVCLLVSLIVSGIYVLCAPHLAPPLTLLWKPWLAAGFILLTPMVTLNALTDNVFIAFRSAKYNVMIDGVVQGSAKLGLMTIMVTLGSAGIFLSFGIGAAVAVAISLVAMNKVFGYEPSMFGPLMSEGGIGRYSVLSYLASIANYSPTFVFPLLIVRGQGTSSAGYFYTTLQIAALLYGLVNALALSLFAEGSQGAVDLRRVTKRVSGTLAVLLVPAMAIMIAFSPLILGIFGQSYKDHSRSLLIVLILASVPVALNVITSTLLRIHSEFGALIASNIVFAISACGLAALWIDRSLWWTGLALFIGDGLSGLYGLFILVARVPRGVCRPAA